MVLIPREHCLTDPDLWQAPLREDSTFLSADHSISHIYLPLCGNPRPALPTRPLALISLRGPELVLFPVSVSSEGKSPSSFPARTLPSRFSCFVFSLTPSTPKIFYPFTYRLELFTFPYNLSWVPSTHPLERNNLLKDTSKTFQGSKGDSPGIPSPLGKGDSTLSDGKEIF